MFRRSDSFTSICSCSTDPPEMLLEDEDISLESYQQVDNYQELDSYQELGDYSIPINPELDFVQQPNHRIVNFSLNQPKYKSLLEYWKIRNDINNHDPSELGSNFRNPIQKESENNQLLKEFVPDMDMLGKEFNSEKNRVKREAYRANHTTEIGRAHV